MSSKKVVTNLDIFSFSV